MDDQGFDRFVRRWGARASRRGALQYLSAGLLVGWSLRRTGNGAVAQESTGPIACSHDDDCRDGDLDPCTGAACVDGLCTFFIVDCIPGSTCCGNGACCPAGAIGGCRVDTDCAPITSNPCWGTACVGGICVAQHVMCAASTFCRHGACVPFGAEAIPVP